MSINIINRALIKLGQPTISSTAQDPNGRIFGIVFQDLRDWLLASYPWRFAIKRIILAHDEDNSVSGFSYAYTLPADFLSLYRFGRYFKMPNYSDNIISSDERYSIEGNKILCNIADGLHLTYVAKIEDTAKFSVSFREALVNKLAGEFAARIKQSANLAQTLDKAFAYYMDQAQQNDELMTDSESIPDGSWVGIREAWHNEY